MKARIRLTVVAVLLAGALPALPQEKTSSPSSASSVAPVSPNVTPTTDASPATGAAGAGQPNEADMQKMMEEMREYAKITENHKLLGELAGTWNYTIKFWMDPSGPPNESTGTATRRAIMDGRYYETESTGEIEMPGPGGKMQKTSFKGRAVEGYDNVKKKFWSTWIDNMATGIMLAEGTYDPATKTWTFHGEMESMPGMKQKIREVVKIIDKDKHIFEMFEERAGKEVKMMEITYTRKK